MHQLCTTVRFFSVAAASRPLSVFLASSHFPPGVLRKRRLRADQNKHFHRGNPRLHSPANFCFYLHEYLEAVASASSKLREIPPPPPPRPVKTRPPPVIDDAPSGKSRFLFFTLPLACLQQSVVLNVQPYQANGSPRPRLPGAVPPTYRNVTAARASIRRGAEKNGA